MPFDFWLFDYIKRRLGDVSDIKDLVKSVTTILKNINTSEYRETFRRYKERLEYCILAEGDYFEHLIK